MSKPSSFVNGFNRKEGLERVETELLTLRAMAKRIDSVSDLDYCPSDIDADICFAANSLQGPIAILERARDRLKRMRK